MAVMGPETQRTVGRIALWHLAFRPFFLGACLWAVISILVWLGIYALDWRLPLAGLSPSLWHAHEMIFGFALAVIAGFLPTAVMNWTGVQTLNEAPLAGLFALWVVARLLFLFGDAETLNLALGTNLLFMLGLGLSVLRPVWRTRQWKQLPVGAIVLLMMLSELLLADPGSVRTGVYAGLLSTILLILVMGRRVIPFFIERGVEGDCTIIHFRWLDVGCVLFYMAYMTAELLAPVSTWTAILAGWTALFHGGRLILWHRTGLWHKPLLWVLWLGYAFIVSGFALRAFGPFWSINPYLGVHALTYGGIGVLTLGMMARVTLGHTGRNVFKPPPSLGWMFALLITGACLRVFAPLIAPSAYATWTILSQGLWMAAFGMFLLIFTPMLIRPRVDGRYG